MRMHFNVEPYELSEEKFAQLYSEARWIESFRNEQRIKANEDLLHALITITQKR